MKTFHQPYKFARLFEPRFFIQTYTPSPEMEVSNFLQLMTYAHSEAVHLLITTTPSGHSLPFQLFITFGWLISIYFGCDYLTPDDFRSELILKV